MTRVRLRLRLSKYRVAFEHLSKPVKTSDRTAPLLIRILIARVRIVLAYQVGVELMHALLLRRCERWERARFAGCGTLLWGLSLHIYQLTVPVRDVATESFSGGQSVI